MLRWIALIIITIFSIDTLVCWAAGLYQQGVVLTLLVGALWYYWIKSYKTRLNEVTVASGWMMAEGTEISDPDAPKKVRVVLEEHMIKKGILAYGSPDSGKTTTLLIGYLHYLSTMLPGTGWLAADGKGDKDMYAYLVATGVEPDFFLSTVAPESDTINLLGSNDAYEATEIAVAVLLDADRKGDSVFYQEAEENHLRAAIPVLKDRENLGGPPLTLRELLAFTLDFKCAEEVLNEAVQRNDRVETIAKLRYWHNLKPKDRLGPLKGLIQRLEIMATSPGSDRWNDPYPSLNLEDAINQSKKIFLHLPFSPMAKKLSVAITELILFAANRRQIEGGKKAQLFATLWEDWGGFMNANWANIVSRTRSANMSASFSFQSLDQTDVVRISKQLDDSILTKFVFSVDGVDSAKRCAEMLGTYESVQVSVSDRTGTRFDGTNTSVVRKPRITEEDIWSLAKGEAYLITRSADDEGRVQKRFYRVRPPLVKTLMDPDSISWPSITHECGLGDGLWANYIERKTISNAIAAEQGLAFDHDKKAAEEGIEVVELPKEEQPMQQQEVPAFVDEIHSTQSLDLDDDLFGPVVLTEEPIEWMELEQHEPLQDELSQPTPTQTSTAKKTTATSTAVKKTTAKKASAKKTSTRASTAKKSTAKKTSAKKTTAKKTSAKKSTAKRSARKKTVKADSEPVIHSAEFEDV